MNHEDSRLKRRHAQALRISKPGDPWSRDLGNYASNGCHPNRRTFTWTVICCHPVRYGYVECADAGSQLHISEESFADLSGAEFPGLALRRSLRLSFGKTYFLCEALQTSLLFSDDSVLLNFRKYPTHALTGCRMPQRVTLRSSSSQIIPQAVVLQRCAHASLHRYAPTLI